MTDPSKVQRFWIPTHFQYTRLSEESVEVVLAKDYDALRTENERLTYRQQVIADTVGEENWSLRKQLATALARVEFSKQGKCLKCNAGPMRESCAYPEACEHPGLKLALAYNQSLLTTAELNGQLRTAQARCAQLDKALRGLMGYPDLRKYVGSIVWEETTQALTPAGEREGEG